MVTKAHSYQRVYRRGKARHPYRARHQTLNHNIQGDKNHIETSLSTIPKIYLNLGTSVQTLARNPTRTPLFLSSLALASYHMTFRSGHAHNCHHARGVVKVDGGPIHRKPFAYAKKYILSRAMDRFL